MTLLKNWVFWWLALLLVLTTIEYRFDLGFFSIAVFEPVALIGIFVIVVQRLRARQPFHFKEPFLLLFMLLTLWALLIRGFSANWQHGLSDIRDWIIPTLTLWALFNLEKPVPRSVFAVLSFLAIGYGLFSTFQHYTDSFRPFATYFSSVKLEILPSDGTLKRASAGIGFYGSPNGLGTFFALSIPVLWGWLYANSQKWGLWRYGLLLPALVGLYFTYSKLSVLMLGFATLLLIAHYLIPAANTRRFAQIIAGVVAVGAIGFVIALQVLPYAMVGTFWWRVALWEIVGVTLRQFPSIWVAGNGMDPFAALSFHGQPHNLYLYMLLDYGVIGLALTFAVFGGLLYTGLRARQDGLMHSDPMLAPLWIALVAQFGVAMLETTWLASLWRELFVVVLYLYVQLNPAVMTWRFPRLRSVLTPSV